MAVRKKTKRSAAASTRGKKKARKVKHTAASELARQSVELAKRGHNLKPAADDTVDSNITTYIPTGLIGIDRMLGEGRGIPCGRVTSFFGTSHFGKSTLLAHVFREAQKLGGVSVLIDTERTHNREYAGNIGVDTNHLQMLTPNRFTMEGVFQAIYDWVATRPNLSPAIIGVDSISAVPTDGMIRSMEEGTKVKPGEAAKAISEGLRNITGVLAQANVALVMINHEYTTFGNRYAGKTPYGGEGLTKHATLILRFRSAGNRLKKKIDGEEKIVGKQVAIKVEKSKMSGVSEHQCIEALIHGRGFDNSWVIFEGLKKKGLIKSAGAWYSAHFPGESEPRRWQQGHFGLQDILQKDPELMSNLVGVYQDLFPYSEYQPLVVVEEEIDAAV